MYPACGLKPWTQPTYAAHGLNPWMKPMSYAHVGSRWNKHMDYTHGLSPWTKHTDYAHGLSLWTKPMDEWIYALLKERGWPNRFSAISPSTYAFCVRCLRAFMYFVIGETVIFLKSYTEVLYNVAPTRCYSAGSVCPSG